MLRYVASACNEATNICPALNDGVHFSDQTVPLYYLEKALAVTATSTATVRRCMLNR
jgi:hypothetical protein